MNKYREWKTEIIWLEAVIAYQASHRKGEKPKEVNSCLEDGSLRDSPVFDSQTSKEDQDIDISIQRMICSMTNLCLLMDL